ncbi:MAG TPA: hypothetical protein ENJ04_10320 [Nitrospirae bacterium]|nr:hypothetical protein [Nitrospirota bacterium]
MKQLNILVFLTVLVFTWSGTSFAQVAQPDKNYVLGPEDVIEIRVWGNDDLNRTVEISKEGSFTFPLIGRVKANGYTVFEVERLLTEKLSDGYLVAPQVNVSIVQYRSQKVFVLGEVRKPGRYMIKGKTNVLELISEAGGPTEMAADTITIMRSGSNIAPGGSGLLQDDGKNEVITLKFDDVASSKGVAFYVESGDTVYIARAPRFFVTGEVVRPGEFRWEEGITVRGAISMAGGPTDRGAVNRAKIIRSTNGEERQIRPEMNDPVMPDDVVKVPESYF